MWDMLGWIPMIQVAGVVKKGPCELISYNKVTSCKVMDMALLHTCNLRITHSSFDSIGLLDVKIAKGS